MDQMDEKRMAASSSGRRIVVALCGRRGAGKDAVAEMLARSSGYHPMKFARPLKDVLSTLFGFGVEHVDGALRDVVHPALGTTPRKIMQWFGTDVMQHALSEVAPGQRHRRFWAERLCESVRRLGPDARVVISDMRFRHELDTLREAFGVDNVVAVKVERRHAEGRVAYEADDHESEASVDAIDADLILDNDGTVEHLDFAASRLLRFGEKYDLSDGTTVTLVGARLGRLVVDRDGDRESVSVREWLAKTPVPAAMLLLA